MSGILNGGSGEVSHSGRTCVCLHMAPRPQQQLKCPVIATDTENLSTANTSHQCCCLSWQNTDMRKNIFHTSKLHEGEASRAVEDKAGNCQLSDV